MRKTALVLAALLAVAGVYGTQAPEQRHNCRAGVLS